jgi:hypothetical protein
LKVGGAGDPGTVAVGALTIGAAGADGLAGALGGVGAVGGDRGGDGALVAGTIRSCVRRHGPI